jgi:ssRNA-specific RNase YbeY (16S rRNA maturation enzyme)
MKLNFRGRANDHKMKLAELEEYLKKIREMGGQDDTKVTVLIAFNGEIKEINTEV